MSSENDNKANKLGYEAKLGETEAEWKDLFSSFYRQDVQNIIDSEEHEVTFPFEEDHVPYEMTVKVFSADSQRRPEFILVDIYTSGIHAQQAFAQAFWSDMTPEIYELREFSRRGNNKGHSLLRIAQIVKAGIEGRPITPDGLIVNVDPITDRAMPELELPRGRQLN